MTAKTTINVHPKVFTGLLIGLGITVVGSVTAYLDPDAFSFLGVWSAPAFALATTGLSLLGSWLKKAEAGEATSSVADVSGGSVVADVSDVSPVGLDPEPDPAVDATVA